MNKVVETIKDDIAVSILADRLRYEPRGWLVWRSRPLSDFQNSHRMNLWNSRYAGKRAGSVDRRANHGRMAITIDGKTHWFLTARVIWAIQTGYWPSGVIDHINGDGSDDRFENMRVVSQRENMRNMARYSSNTTGVSGVYRSVQSGKLIAHISIGGKVRHLGVFDDLDDASKARRKAEAKVGYHPNHGKRARVRAKRSDG